MHREGLDSNAVVLPYQVLLYHGMSLYQVLYGRSYCRSSSPLVTLLGLQQHKQHLHDLVSHAKSMSRSQPCLKLLRATQLNNRCSIATRLDSSTDRSKLGAFCAASTLCCYGTPVVHLASPVTLGGLCQKPTGLINHRLLAVMLSCMYCMHNAWMQFSVA